MAAAVGIAAEPEATAERGGTGRGVEEGNPGQFLVRQDGPTDRQDRHEQEDPLRAVRHGPFLERHYSTHAVRVRVAGHRRPWRITIIFSMIYSLPGALRPGSKYLEG